VSAAGSSRAEVADIARRLTADLDRLRALVVARSGAENAAALHQNAAVGVHHLIAATGVYGGSR
jgi:hypothetical protein